MKKSFLYAVPAALIMALLFAGCPQDSDDDDDDGGPIPSYQKDVDGIAVAFADGAPVVYLKDNLHLGDNELVIPAGKTLDLSRNVKIDEIGLNGKIVVVGNIVFNSGENANKYDIELYKSPTAKIIATDDFINANVDARYVLNNDGTPILGSDSEGNQYTEDPSRHIKALADQVIAIAGFDIADANQWEAYITEHDGQGNAAYIPVQFNGTINKAIAGVVGKYGSGRRVYIIGDVTITGPVDLTQTKWDPLPPPDPDTSQLGLYNFIDDADGSLLIAGAVVFEGGDGEVKTSGGLTVLGTLTTKGDRDIAKVNAAGPLVTYLLRLDSGGGSFGGDVILIGSLPSKLGGEAVFFGNLTARGTVIIDGVTFNGGAEFNGPVEFIGPEGSVIIAPGKEVVLNGPVTVSNVNPVNLLNGQFKAGDALPGYTYNIPIEFSEDTAITGGTVSFTKPVTFNSTVDLTYVTGTFSAGVIFNDNVTFGTGIYYFGTYAANNDYKTSFAKTLKLKSAQLYGGSFGLPVTFNSAATFTGGSVAFNGQADFKGDLTLSEAAGTFTGGAQFAQNVNFAAGSQVTIGANTTLTHSSGLVIAPIGKTTVGYIIPDAEATGDFVTLLDASGKFTIPKGTLSLGSASIDITNGGEIVIGVKGGREAGIVFGTEGTPVAQAGLVYIKSSAYEIAAGTSAGGTLVGFLGTVASAGADTITLSNNSFTSSGPKGGSRSQAVLKFAGSNTATSGGIVYPHKQT